MRQKFHAIESCGGFAWGSERKKELLSLEGIEVVSGKIVDFEKKRWKFD